MSFSDRSQRDVSEQSVSGRLISNPTHIVVIVIWRLFPTERCQYLRTFHASRYCNPKVQHLPLPRHDGQIRRHKVAAGREYRLTTECRKRINRAVPEVELRSVPPALSKTAKRRDSRFRLGPVKWNNLAVEVFDQPVQRGQRLCAQSTY